MPGAPEVVVVRRWCRSSTARSKETIPRCAASGCCAKARAPILVPSTGPVPREPLRARQSTERPPFHDVGCNPGAGGAARGEALEAAGAVPASQPSQTMPTATAPSTAQMATRPKLEKNASVLEETPVNARPTTGRTGTPQPITLQELVEKPRTLVSAPATPPGRRRCCPSQTPSTRTDGGPRGRSRSRRGPTSAGSGRATGRR